MKGKFALLLLAILLLGMFSASVSAHSATIDGNLADWTGTPPATDNTWTVSAGEGIWRDAAADDRGNGSYIYPNNTIGGIPDSMGGPDGNAYQYTGYPGGGVRGGGFLDLREFRITADSGALYMLFRFENMGRSDIALEWNYWCHNTTWGWDSNATGWGKLKLEVYIDEDRIPGSGRTDTNSPTPTNPTDGGNFLIDPSAAWEDCVDIQGDNRRFTYESWPVPPAYIGGGLPRVISSDGTETLLNQSSGLGTKCLYTQGNPDIYPSAIEMKVPYWALQASPLGKTWRFTVVVGGADEGNWRQVWNTSLAVGMGWPYMFRFIGGEGGDSWAGGYGNDPNVIDMAFTKSQAAQEAMLNSFTKLPGTGLAVVKAYQDVYFTSSGDVGATGPVGGFISPLDTLASMAPWIALVVVTVAAASVVYRRKHVTKTI